MSDVANLGQVVSARTADIKLAADNPRHIPPAAIESVIASLRRFGWQQPIVVDSQNVVIAGHTRLQAARKLGLQTVPVVVADHLTPDEARAYRIADNRTHDYSTWDLPLLTEQLDELAGDFSEELGLADWEAIVGEYENLMSEDDDPDFSLDPIPASAPPAPVTATPAPTITPAYSPPTPAAAPPARAASETDLEVSEEVRGHVASFEIVVCFRSKADADAAGPAIMSLPGAVDVRYKR